MMNWELFWQSLSAIGTIAAVIIALWSNGYYNQKRLKIITNTTINDMSLSDGFLEQDKKIVEAEITNVGKYDIVLKSLNYKVHNLSVKSIGNRISRMDDGFQWEDEDFPIKIVPGESFVIMFFASNITETPINTQQLYRLKKSNRKVKLFFTDSTLKKYRFKTGITNKDITYSEKIHLPITSHS